MKVYFILFEIGNKKKKWRGMRIYSRESNHCALRLNIYEVLNVYGIVRVQWTKKKQKE